MKIIEHNHFICHYYGLTEPCKPAHLRHKKRELLQCNSLIFKSSAWDSNFILNLLIICMLFVKRLYLHRFHLVTITSLCLVQPTRLLITIQIYEIIQRYGKFIYFDLLVWIKNHFRKASILFDSNSFFMSDSLYRILPPS